MMLFFFISGMKVSAHVKSPVLMGEPVVLTCKYSPVNNDKQVIWMRQTDDRKIDRIWHFRGNIVAENNTAEDGFESDLEAVNQNSFKAEHKIEIKRTTLEWGYAYYWCVVNVTAEKEFMSSYARLNFYGRNCSSCLIGPKSESQISLL